MTRRSRSVLIDATLGKIFINTDSVQSADPSKLIAGTKLLNSIISSKPNNVVKITNNLSATPAGIRFPSGGLVTNFILSAAVAPVGRSIMLRIKVGTSYETSVLLDSRELESGVRLKAIPVSWTVPTGQSLYVDITQVGNIKPGSGLNVQFNYYSG
jgi:hypothetical protein